MGKRLIIKGANFETNGMPVYKYVQVTTKQVVTNYTNNKLNVSNIIDVSAITANTEYYIKVTSNSDKFNGSTLTLLTSKDSSFKMILEFNIGEYGSFKVEDVPNSFLLQTMQAFDTTVVADATLTISVYKKQEFV